MDTMENKDLEHVKLVTQWVDRELEYRKSRAIFEIEGNERVDEEDVSRLMKGELKRTLLLAARHFKAER
ncbi:hypothetical protein AX774_g1239 [Zancudomyces culisetae]|uniref:Uncharacterized protein n=1 Tax=Zancudomyces culisetae TaxID=1213189 RepID=A0A1R1PW53_ZANCU|nr:hypothetical protein AX774_g1239 [Zancudomyces culisetae]|eukprot:OMH85215.1 hypothetical protein AX774_g1239 [Zancudomyces culisetae]